MRLASVCSGIGGAELAFTGIASHVFASETEAFPRAVLRHHFPGLHVYGDFRDIPADAGPVDVLAGGTPCQSFSVAGLRRGLADERGNLALEYLRLVDRIRPRWVLWENVPGVLSSDGGRDFGAFLGGLGDCGYGWAYRCLDAAHFGLAQRRKRVFVVGCAGDWRRAAAVLFEPASLRGDTAPGRATRQGTAPTLASRASAGGGLGTDFDCDGGLIAFDARNNGTGDVSTPLQSASGRQSYSLNKQPLLAYGGNNTAGSIGVATAVRSHNGSGWHGDFDSETFIAYRLHADGSMAMTGNGNAAAAAPVDVARSLDTCGGFTAGQGGNLIAHSLRADGFDASEDGTPLVAQRSQVRRLTLTECERLMGVPDGYTAIMFRGKPAADGPRYRALGNAFAIPVVRWIARRIALEHALGCEVAA